jgi:hypothetical protein
MNWFKSHLRVYEHLCIFFGQRPTSRTASTQRAKVPAMGIA